MEELVRDFPKCDFSFVDENNMSYERFVNLHEINDYVNNRLKNRKMEDAMFIIYGTTRVAIKGDDKVLDKDVLLLFIDASNVKKFEFVGVK